MKSDLDPEFAKFKSNPDQDRDLQFSNKNFQITLKGRSSFIRFLHISPLFCETILGWLGTNSEWQERIHLRRYLPFVEKVFYLHEIRITIIRLESYDTVPNIPVPD